MLQYQRRCIGKAPHEGPEISPTCGAGLFSRRHCIIIIPLQPHVLDTSADMPLSSHVGHIPWPSIGSGPNATFGLCTGCACYGRGGLRDWPPSAGSPMVGNISIASGPALCRHYICEGGDEAPATYTMFDTIVLLYGWRPPKWMRASLRSVWSHGSGNRPGLCWQARASKRTADGFVQRASRGNTKDTEMCAYIVDAFAFMFVVVHIVVLLPHCCRTMGMIYLLWVVFVGWRSAARLGRQEATPLLRRAPSAFAAS